MILFITWGLAVFIMILKMHIWDKHQCSLWCWFGMHDWYKGCFTFPVYNRYERHCLECDKRQYHHYNPTDKTTSWITFKLTKHEKETKPIH